MTRNGHRHIPLSIVRFVLSTAVVITATATTVAPGMAQDADWRIVGNPYQEDIEYSFGSTHTPRIEVDGVRWHSFRIETPDGALLTDGETVETDVTLEIENRRTKSAKILVILLLEDENGNPLDRIEVKQFKVTGGRLKERTETASLSSEIITSARRVYVFFEVLQ